VVFALLDTGKSPTDVGLTLGASTAARVSFSLIGGAWADRLPRRLVVVGSDLAQAAALTIVAVLLLSRAIQTWEVLVCAVVSAVAAAFVEPAMTGLVLETVPADSLQQANALLSTSRSIAKIVGPPVAGVVVVEAGPGWLYAADALSFLLGVLCLSQVPLPSRARQASGRFLADLLEGWQELRTRPWYWSNVVAHGVFNVAITPFLVLGPVIAMQRLGGASAWGLISAGGAAGAVLGGAIALRWTPSRPLLVGNLALGLSVTQVLALVPPLPLLLIMLSAMASSIGFTFLNQMWLTAQQRLVPEHIVSRLSSYDWLAALLAMPLGYASVGPMAARIGTNWTLGIAAAMILGACVLSIAAPEIRGRDSAREMEATARP
jgi:predicted MFS family arabinose efflux permease